MFDVSHMGQIETSGPGSLALLQRLLSNDLAKVPVGGAQYGVLCREDGGVLDDVFSYRLEPDRYLTVTNAANHERDLDWFRAHASDFPGAEVADRIDDYAMLAVQGPRAREVVQAIADAPLARADDRRPAAGGGRPDARLRHRLHGRGRRRAAARAGDAPALWDELAAARRDARRAGRARHAAPGGLLLPVRQRADAPSAGRSRPAWAGAARRTPASSARTRCAPRASAVRRERLVAFAIDGPGIARAGNPIAGGGVVTSGTLSPTLGIGVGLAYVPAERAAVGSRLEIDVRGKMRRGRGAREAALPPRGSTLS